LGSTTSDAGVERLLLASNGFGSCPATAEAARCGHGVTLAADDPHLVEQQPAESPTA
jgi:hypothetical protein